MPNIKIADLIAEAHVQNDKMIRELQQLRQSVDNQTDKMSGSFKNVERTGSAAFSRLGRFAKRTIKYGIVAALGAMAAAIVKSVRTSANFETLQLRLEQLSGSAEAGKKRFEELVKFAANTPFELNEIVEAEATLKSFGDTNKESIKAMGDLAVFMGVSLPEAAAAYGRAFAGGAGAADIFRERGVLNLIKMESGIDDLTKLTLPEFRKAMEKTFTDPDGKISGGTVKLANTLEGRWSTFKDNVNLAFKKVGDVMKTELLTTLNTVITKIGSFVDSGKAESLGKNLAKGINLAVSAMGKLSGFFTTSKKERIAEINHEIGMLQGNIDNLNSPLNRLFGQNSQDRIEKYERKIRQLRHELAVLKGEVTPEGPQLPAAGGGSTGQTGSDGGTLVDKTDDFDKLKKKIEEAKAAYKELESDFFTKDFEGDLEKEIERDFEKKMRKKRRELKGEIEPEEEVLNVENIQAGARAMDAFVDGLIDANNFTLNLGNAFKMFASQVVAELERVIAKMLILKAFELFGVPTAVSKPILGFAKGTNGYQTVPGGFPNDSFGIGLTSGERFKVTPPGGADNETRLLSKIDGKLGAMNVNIARLGMRQIAIENELNVDSRGLHLLNKQEQRKENSYR